MSDEEKARVRKMQEEDQALARMADTLPAVFWRMYKNLCEEGFSEGQAMSLLQTFIASAIGAIKP
jgi:G:T/U-mismatch repair DNA glycosylase